MSSLGEYLGVLIVFLGCGVDCVQAAIQAGEFAPVMLFELFKLAFLLL